MDKHDPATEQIRQIAGHVRLLAALMRPVPHLPEVDRGAFERALHHVAANLDHVARNTAQCRDCPKGTWEDERP